MLHASRTQTLQAGSDGVQLFAPLPSAEQRYGLCHFCGLVNEGLSQPVVTIGSGLNYQDTFHKFN